MNGRGAGRDPEGALVPRRLYAALEECTYLNQASLGLVPRPTIEAMTRFLVDVGQYGNVRLSDDAEARVLDGLRQGAATLFDTPPRSIAVLAGASEGLGQVAAALASGLRSDAPEVVLVTTDFPSVTYPWIAASDRNLATSPVLRWVVDDPGSDLTDGLVAAVNERTGVVCVSAVQYSTGTRIDVAAVARAAHTVGARVVVDVTQLAGAAPVSMREWGVDALVCSGYKWLSAHGGVALAALSPEMTELVPPVVGWMGAEDPFDFTATDLTLASGARRFELSTMSYASAVGLQHSIDLLSSTGIPALADHSRLLAHELVDLVSPSGWYPFRPVGDPAASHHLVSLRHPRASGRDVQATLARDHSVFTSSRGGGIRVSLHGYNTSADLHALATALTRVT
ncbi:aminotransferase class V-fold PLP-dependent enzyme [Nocardioides sp. Soil805]|uniref:aminotransferase class V-fold PLP-dependent enzyme n=1 Tax=Nocardioides sp. Soil805 TaxID=1736416 RepID=UPI000AD3F0C3|nr:aminotransferase class V-fold PLP-dependent enzyme [Nocardioides sp. Soil805]